MHAKAKHDTPLIFLVEIPDRERRGGVYHNQVSITLNTSVIFLFAYKTSAFSLFHTFHSDSGEKSRSLSFIFFRALLGLMTWY